MSALIPLAVSLGLACLAAGIALERRRTRHDPDQVLAADLDQAHAALRVAGRVEAAAVRRCVGCPLSPYYPQGVTRE